MKKKYFIWTFLIIFFLSAIIGTSILLIHTLFDKDSPLQMQHEKSITSKKTTNKEVIKEIDPEMDMEQVNQPVSEEVVVLSDGTSGHSFISTWHNFYNSTLGWGKIDTADYEEQKEAAETILSELKNVKVTNEQIAEDLKDIQTNAQVITEKADHTIYRNLHRYFHDLDIYFNGYSYNQTFGITEFRGL
ncbi:MAG TPA: hypothetical protein VNR61_04140 [Niallia sp.]|nr:hypothetical protein [Niallia sp.]